MQIAKSGIGNGVLLSCLRIIAAFALFSSSAAGRKADELHYFAGISVTSNDVSNGIMQSNGNLAVQTYVELRENGFYSGLFMSKVDYQPADSVAMDIYL